MKTFCLTFPCRERRGDVCGHPPGDHPQELGGVVRGHCLVGLLPGLHRRNLCPDGTRHPGEEEGAETRGQKGAAIPRVSHVTQQSSDHVTWAVNEFNEVTVKRFPVLNDVNVIHGRVKNGWKMFGL